MLQFTDDSRTVVPSDPQKTRCGEPAIIDARGGSPGFHSTPAGQFLEQIVDPDRALPEVFCKHDVALYPRESGIKDTASVGGHGERGVGGKAGTLGEIRNEFCAARRKPEEPDAGWIRLNVEVPSLPRTQ